MTASLSVRRLALLGGLAASAHASALIWSNNNDDGLHYAVKDVDSFTKRDLQQRADATLCGYINGDALSCRSGQVCSADHQNQVIGCCPKNNPQCTIAQSCGNEDSFGGFFGRDKRDTKILTCGSGIWAPSCFAYSYSGGPYDGYSMYACLSDTFFAPVPISMNQRLDSDDQPITTTRPATTATTKPQQTTNQSTRPTTTRPPIQTSKNDGITSTADPATTTTGGTSLSSVTGNNAVPTSSTSSGPLETGVSGAISGSTVPSGSNAGAIAGGVIGGVAFILLCIGAIMYYLWWRRKRDEEATYNPSMAYSGQERSESALRRNIPSHPNMKGDPWTFSQYSPGGVAYGAGAPPVPVVSSSWYRNSDATSQHPGPGYYGKTADDTGVSPISSSVSPPDSPVQGSRSPPRPVSPQQTYSRHNPPPPERFRAYQPYEGT